MPGQWTQQRIDDHYTAIFASMDRRAAIVAIRGFKRQTWALLATGRKTYLNDCRIFTLAEINNDTSEGREHIIQRLVFAIHAHRAALNRKEHHADICRLEQLRECLLAERYGRRMLNTLRAMQEAAE